MRYTNDEIIRKSKRINRRRKIIKIIVYIIAVPIIFYNISLIFFSVVNKNETPSFFGIKTFVIISGSMEPELNIGDIVIIKKCSQEELKENDIISYKYGQSEITHRIIQIEDNENGKEYITKGDNNNVRDSENIKYENIEGKCIGKIRHLGKVILILKNKIVLICIILILYLIYAGDTKRNKKWDLRREKREKFEEERR